MNNIFRRVILAFSPQKRADREAMEARIQRKLNRAKLRRLGYHKVATMLEKKEVSMANYPLRHTKPDMLNSNLIQIAVAQEMGLDLIEWIDAHAKTFRTLYTENPNRSPREYANLLKKIPVQGKEDSHGK